MCGRRSLSWRAVAMFSAMKKKTRAERIAELEKREKDLAARLSQVKRRIGVFRRADREEERKRDTRRKIIVGAWLMSRPEWKSALRSEFLSGLRAGRDRELFGLDPLASAAPSAPAAAPAPAAAVASARPSPADAPGVQR